MSVIVSVPVTRPVAVGMKVRLISQLPLAGMPLPQVLVWANGPLIEIEVMLRGLSVLRVAVCGALVEPSGWEVKVRLAGETAPTGGTPVPERATLRGLPGKLSVMVTAPVLAPPAVGVNVTWIVQLACAASTCGRAGQSLVWAKSPLVAILGIVMPDEALLVSVIACAALVVLRF